MISPASISIRCDGVDRTNGDKCKSSVVLSVDLDDLKFLPPDREPLNRAYFFVSRIPGWVVVIPGKILCPSCSK